MGIVDEEEAQVSAELIIVIAALIAVAIVLITQLKGTAQEGRKVLKRETEQAWDLINETSRR